MPKCLHCGEELRWIQQRGWVHQDGESYKTYKGKPNPRHPGEMIGDHYASPDFAPEEKSGMEKRE